LVLLGTLPAHDVLTLCGSDLVIVISLAALALRSTLTVVGEDGKVGLLDPRLLESGIGNFIPETEVWELFYRKAVLAGPESMQLVIVALHLRLVNAGLTTAARLALRA
jgi:hypothetical protein